MLNKPLILFKNHNKILKCEDYGNFYKLLSDGNYVNFNRFIKFKFGKSGLLWGYWNTNDMGNKYYRDCLVGRFLTVIKPRFEVVSKSELIIWKN